jgi:hypothetical protein
MSFASESVDGTEEPGSNTLKDSTNKSSSIRQKIDDTVKSLGSTVCNRDLNPGVR